MRKGKFPLGKWESNIEEMDDDRERVKAKLFGVSWNKKDEKFAVEMNETATISKRTILKMLASIYDP